MPTVAANGITIHYDVEGSGEPLVLIPFLGADNSCYAFQVADYAKHFTCYSVDLRGAGGCAHAPISEDPETFNRTTSSSC